jgi:hypothetical protein
MLCFSISDKTSYVLWSSAYFSPFSMAKTKIHSMHTYIFFLILLLAVKIVVSVAVVVKRLIPHPILNVFPLKRYFSIINKSGK